MLSLWSIQLQVHNDLSILILPTINCLFQMFDCFCKDGSNNILTTDNVLPLPPTPLVIDSPNCRAPIPSRYQTSGGRLATHPDTIWMSHYTTMQKGWRGRRRDLFYN